MRAFTILLSFAILASFLVRHSDAVACESLNPDVPAGCTDCTDPANDTDDDCTTTTTTTTEATTTTTTTAATSTGTGTGTGTRRPNRQIIRISNLRYTNVRRVRVNRNNRRNNQNAGRRPNVNVHVIQG